MSKNYRLHCWKCKKFADKIKEVYGEPLIEHRIYHEGIYELEWSNISDMNVVGTYCLKCGTELFGNPEEKVTTKMDKNE